MENKISVIIPCFNENITKIQRSVDHFSSNPLVSQVIIVDDNSTIPIQIKNAKVIRNEMYLGRSASRSIGAFSANSPIILTTDLNSRFKTKDWAKYIIESVLVNPKSIICPSCIPTGQCSLRGKIYGGYLDCITSRGGKPVVLESRWRVETPLNKIVDCVMGETYAFDSKFIKAIGGYKGIKGRCPTETVALSLKTRLVGGTCMVLPNVEVEHEFSLNSTISPIAYNKMRLAFATMPPEVSNIIPILLTGTLNLQDSVNEFMADFRQLVEDREQFREICKVEPYEAFKRAGIDLGINLKK
jgi:glycosyltransferase involved in cell wall biosynthesis